MSGEDPASLPAGTLRAGQALRDGLDMADEAGRTHRALLAHIRHELRTPLGAVIGYSEMLLDDAPAQGRENVIADLQKIHAAGNDLLTHLNAILDPATIDAGQLDGDLEVVGA